MKLGAVILSYNDSNGALAQANRLNSFNLFDKIVIVDNCSNHKEKDILKKAKINNTIIIFNKTNLGYGAGNNVGIKYLEKLGFKYVLLINNDIEMQKQSILDCYNFIVEHEKCAAVSPLMIEKGKIKRNYYDIPNLANTLNFVSSTFGKKCKSMVKKDDYIQVDYVRESASIYSIKCLKSINYFDENIFMFEEGPSTGFLFKKCGYFEAILPKAKPYIHNHKGPLINRKLFALNKKSRIYFFKNYLNYGWFKILIFRLYWVNIFIK